MAFDEDLTEGKSLQRLFLKEYPLASLREEIFYKSAHFLVEAFVKTSNKSSLKLEQKVVAFAKTYLRSLSRTYFMNQPSDVDFQDL